MTVPTSRRVLIDAGPVETRAALQEDGETTRLWVGPAAGEPLPLIPGERISAKVVSIDKTLGAAFVQMADGGEGFLPLPGKQALSEGETIVVDVRNAARSGKRASVRLSADQRPPEGERPDALVFAATLFEDIDECLIAGAAKNISALKSSLGGGTVTAADNELFEREGVEEAFDGALNRTITLANGVRLTIDEAEALTAIDVDTAAVSGQSKAGAALKACEAAVPAIIRRLALRGIGGQVVIDFPLRKTEMGKLEAILKEALKDMADVRMHTISAIGLVALTLPRRLPSLLDSLTEPGTDLPVPGRRFTTRHLAARALRKAENALQQNRTAQLVLHLPAQIATEIENNLQWLAPLYHTYGERLTLKSEDNKKRDWSDVDQTR